MLGALLGASVGALVGAFVGALLGALLGALVGALLGGAAIVHLIFWTSVPVDQPLGGLNWSLQAELL